MLGTEQLFFSLPGLSGSVSVNIRKVESASSKTPTPLPGVRSFPTLDRSKGTGGGFDRRPGFEILLFETLF